MPKTVRYCLHRKACHYVQCLHFTTQCRDVPCQQRCRWIYLPPADDERFSIAHTINEYQPWWRVDLQQIHCIWAVNILNRGAGKIHQLAISSIPQPTASKALANLKLLFSTSNTLMHGKYFNFHCFGRAYILSNQHKHIIQCVQVRNIFVFAKEEEFLNFANSVS